MMKNPGKTMNKYLALFIVVPAISCNTNATTLKDEGISIPVSSKWGQPVYRQYTPHNLTREWRYTINNATLYIIKAICPDCKSFVSNDVDKINKYPELKTTASLLMVNNQPALYSVTKSPKNVNFRNFKLNRNGYQYELQLGISGDTSFNFAFELEKEFLDMINRLSFVTN